MSWNTYLIRCTAVIAFCVVALIIMINKVKINFKNPSLQSYLTRGTYNNSVLKACKNATDMEKFKRFPTVYDLSQENKGNYTCMTMTVIPPTKVCLHDLKKDIWVSRTIAEQGAYERKTLSEFKDELLKDEKLGVLDIGANIGIYTLYAATMGRKVVSVEPFMENLLRIHKAAILGGVRQNIVLLQNAVADTREEGMLNLSSNNQGATHVIKKENCNNKTCPPTVKTILLCDLRYSATFDRAIMKIDIQGFEPRAFTTIESLLGQISIPAIFMEWEFFLPILKKQLDRQSVLNMIQVLTQCGYSPYRLRGNTDKLLDVRLHESWPYYIVWRKSMN